MATNNVTNTYIAVSSGSVTMPVQPAFGAYGNDQTNVTGDGTNYTVLWANEIFDQGSNFASNTFTAPVTGKYQFNISAEFLGLTSVHNQCYLALITTARTYNISYANPYALGFTSGSDVYFDTFDCSLLVDMTASDTAIFKIYLAGNSKTVDIVLFGTHFSGYLVC